MRAATRFVQYGGLLLAVAAAALGGAARADALAGARLIAALQQGGYVLVMRHAHAPQLAAAAGAAEPGTARHERQLDAVGRDAARAMGQALRTLRVPLGTVLSSPTRRALETARLVALREPSVAEELGDGGVSMQATSDSQSSWLRRKAAEPPATGTNTLIVTQSPNIWAAFGASAGLVTDGETLVFRPDGAGGAQLVGRVGIGEWPGDLPR